MSSNWTFVNFDAQPTSRRPATRVVQPVQVNARVRVEDPRTRMADAAEALAGCQALPPTTTGNAPLPPIDDASASASGASASTAGAVSTSVPVAEAPGTTVTTAVLPVAITATAAAGPAAGAPLPGLVVWPAELVAVLVRIRVAMTGEFSAGTASRTVWAEVARRLKEETQTTRSVEQISRKWEDLKRAVKVRINSCGRGWALLLLHVVLLYVCQ